MTDDFPDSEVCGIRAKPFHETFWGTTIAKILGGFAKIQQISDGIKNGHCLNRAAFSIHRISGIWYARATPRGKHQTEMTT